MARGHTNLEQTFTRNRVRHTLLPQLREFQPRIAEHLSRMAAVARDEEAWWDRELARVMPGVVLPGRPVRGGAGQIPQGPVKRGFRWSWSGFAPCTPHYSAGYCAPLPSKLGAALSFDQTEACEP